MTYVNLSHFGVYNAKPEDAKEKGRYAKPLRPSLGRKPRGR